MPGQQFIQYANGLAPAQHGNVRCCAASQTAFKQHLASSSGVICNSGFELISECLQWGKPVLTKPLAGQTEQLSNALALQQLNYATTMPELDNACAARWLDDKPKAPAVSYDDVAAELDRRARKVSRRPGDAKPEAQPS